MKLREFVRWIFYPRPPYRPLWAMFAAVVMLPVMLVGLACLSLSWFAVGEWEEAKEVWRVLF